MMRAGSGVPCERDEGSGMMRAGSDEPVFPTNVMREVL